MDTLHHGTDELLLLRTIIPIIHEVVTYFTGPSVRAEEAKGRLNDSLKEKNRHPSYAAIDADLRTFHATLCRVPEALGRDLHDERRTITDLLHVVETRILQDSEAKRELCDYEAPGDHPGICFLITILEDRPAGEDDGSIRLQTLLENTKLEWPAQRDRQMLVDAIKRCCDALEPHVSPEVVDISWIPNDGRQAEWDGARTLYGAAEKLHAALKRCWDCSNCRCPDQHKHTKFAFDLSAHPEADAINCMLFYPHSPARLPARLSYDAMSHEGHFGTASALSPGHGRRDMKIASITRQSSSKPGHICTLLQSMQLDSILNLSDTSIDIKHHTGNSELFPLYDLNQALTIKAWSELSQGPDLHFSKLKHRLTLALILCYSFLHLGGGPWWPYNRGDDNIHLLIGEEIESHHLRAPFYVPSLDWSAETQAPWLLTMFNQSMPSLPAFGKLLFELILGRGVSWENMEKEMRKFEDEAHAAEILAAVKACTGQGDDKTFTSGGKIRDDERLRMHFVNEVLLRIQFVLDVAYNVKVQDIFTATTTLKVGPAPSLGLHIEPDRSLSPAGFDETLRVMECRSPSPSPSPSLDIASIVSPGFCLHDGHPMEQLSSTSANSAEHWMQNLGLFNERTFGQGLAREVPEDTLPIRIAVLDTGAAITREDLGGLYDGRLVETRSWLRTGDEAGILLYAHDHEDIPGAVLDIDGHGTHATSVLLDATEGTDIQVFVAQVFGGRAEKRRKDGDLEADTAAAIAKAIRYATDHWKVDVISMSFGYPRIDAVVEDAIDHAYSKRVLMLAAASNCGGSEMPSWPARCEQVMCIHATTGKGNKYDLNPSPWKSDDNFAVLGCSVKALWLPDDSGRRQYAHKSGTSTAAPIAAGLAGCIMSIVRRSMVTYLNAIPDRHIKKSRRVRYEAQMKALGRPSGMRRVFKLMIDPEEENRDGYTFLTPMKMLSQDSQSSYLLEKILASLPT